MRMLFTIPQMVVGFTALASASTATWYGLDALDARPVIVKEWKMAQADQNEVLKGLVEQLESNSASMAAQQQQLSTSVLELQFQTLTLKRKGGELDFMEKQNYCRLAKRLEYSQIEGCDD